MSEWKRLARIAGMAGLLLSANPEPGVTGERLRVERMVGLDDGVELYRPVDLQWSTDGRAWLLDSANHRVLAFDEDWQVVQEIGRKGEAPGEFMQAHSLWVGPSELWVFQAGQIHVFDLDGRYLRVFNAGQRLSRPLWVGGEILSTAPNEEGIGLSLDATGQLLERFGPRCRNTQQLEAMVRCVPWRVLPHATARCALVDRFDGRVHVILEDGGVALAKDLGLGRGRIHGHQVKLVVSDVCAGKDGASWVLHYAKAGGSGRLILYDAGFAEIGRWALPADCRPGEIAETPGGQLCLVDEEGSLIYVCRRPRTGYR